ncbi:MAG: hypothetical protein JXA43_01385 [Candidatus Diapherotrites archaeon]|nr:hypothetical protein [Candidatus Diapherotrites archaeon]
MEIKDFFDGMNEKQIDAFRKFQTDRMTTEDAIDALLEGNMFIAGIDTNSINNQIVFNPEIVKQNPVENKLMTEYELACALGNGDARLVKKDANTGTIVVLKKEERREILADFQLAKKNGYLCFLGLVDKELEAATEAILEQRYR